jgi:hypothetical protein
LPVNWFTANLYLNEFWRRFSYLALTKNLSLKGFQYN